MSGFDADQLIAALAAAPDAEARFAALTRGLSQIGIETVNYGFFDPLQAQQAGADIQFLTTMSAGWMEHYVNDRLMGSDSYVLRVQAGKITPYAWGESVARRVGSKAELNTAMEAQEEGLVSALCVPLASPMNPFAPVAGMTLASAMDEAEFAKVTALHGPALITIAHMFHNASIRQLWRERAGARGLTERERDCLQFLANGERQDGIAHRMGLARVTVEMHLRSARQKLRARTLNEAVARALVFGDIVRG